MLFLIKYQHLEISFISFHWYLIMDNAYDKRKALNLGTTPRQELSIRKELDDVALQTINEIAIAKAQVLAQPPDSVERLKM